MPSWPLFGPFYIPLCSGRVGQLALKLGSTSQALGLLCSLKLYSPAAIGGSSIAKSSTRLLDRRLSPPSRVLVKRHLVLFGLDSR